MDGWRYDPAYQIMPDDRAKCEVAPGAEARLVELVWDQKTMQGPMAQIGFYDIGLVLFNLYLDGHSLVDPPLASEVSSGKAVKVVE
jgi:hypothetical protein